MNSASQKNETLRVHDISWVREIDMTLLVNDKNGKTFILRGVEAIAWDWLVLNFPYVKITGLLATILESSVSEAEARFYTILCQWVENGLLIIEENAAHD